VEDHPRHLDVCDFGVVVREGAILISPD